MEKILTFIEKNSRVDLKDLAVMLGVDEVTVANEIADMEKIFSVQNVWLCSIPYPEAKAYPIQTEPHRAWSFPQSSP